MMDDSMHYLMKVGKASHICLNLGWLKDFMSYDSSRLWLHQKECPIRYHTNAPSI